LDFLTVRFYIKLCKKEEHHAVLHGPNYSIEVRVSAGFVREEQCGGVEKNYQELDL
jgi:hypothetical protein